MPGMEFEYDEKGGTFYYFLLSFFALVLFPATYYLWPRSQQHDDPEKERKKCQCIPCKKKREGLKSSEPWSGAKRHVIKLALVLGWVALALLAYKVSQVEIDFTEFDPYHELGVDRAASMAEIKRTYRKLTLTHHPDKGGDPVRFLRITKAHQALTDDESRENWEKYGNPDGPGAAHFGIALPKWIVEKQNSMWVLAAYGLVFIVILPIVVGTWWYRSIKYSAEQVLMDTTQLYYYFFHKTPTMQLKRVIMILTASMEFEKGHNNEIVSRPSDDEEMRELMRDLPYLNEKNKERPLCYPYSIKARALVHAHLARLDLPPDTLEYDRQYIIKKCPYLVNEMVNIVAQLVAFAHAGRAQHMPKLETVEHCMKLSQMLVQGQWDTKSPLLQLPHICDDMMKHFVAKRRNIRNIHHLAALKDDERRQALRGLSDLEYRNVMNVLASLPYINMDVHTEVLDDEDPTITAGSIVTVTVKLKRQNMDQLFDMTQKEVQERLPQQEQQQIEEEEDDEQTQTQLSPAKKSKVWEKNKKKPKGKAAAKKSKKKVKKPTKSSSVPAVTSSDKDSQDSPQPNGTVAVTKKKKVPTATLR